MSEEIKDPTPGENGGKTFTQDEVNRIISERLAKERTKAEPKEDEREQALKAREARLDCREYLDTKGYPAALLEVLDSSDTAKFKTAVEKLVEAFPHVTGAQPTINGWTPGETVKNNYGGPDPIAAAFKPKT